MVEQLHHTVAGSCSAATAFLCCQFAANFFARISASRKLDCLHQFPNIPVNLVFVYLPRKCRAYVGLKFCLLWDFQQNCRVLTYIGYCPAVSNSVVQKLSLGYLVVVSIDLRVVPFFEEAVIDLSNVYRLFLQVIVNLFFCATVLKF